MNNTLEEKIHSLSQTLETVVGELNKSRGDSMDQSETACAYEREAVERFGPRVSVTTNIADYDFSAYETEPGRKVVAILKAGDVRSKCGNPFVSLTVKRQDGKEKLIKARFVGGGSKATLNPDVTAGERANSAHQVSATASAGDDLGMIAAAAFAIELRQGRSAAFRSFCAFSHGKGRAYCVGVIQPLLAQNPLPAGAFPHEQATHIRGLLNSHFAPEAEKLTGENLAATLPQTQAAAIPGSREAWNADPNARHEFGHFGAYRAFHARSNRVLAAQIKLEREAKTPRLVDGEWTLGKIGTHEQAWLNDPALRRDFSSATSYAAFMRAKGCGAVQDV